MIAVVRPALLSAALEGLARAGRAVWLFVIDVFVCLVRMIAPTLCAAVTLAVAVAVGQVLVAHKQPVTAGYAVGALAVCIVAGLLAWAAHRRWWSR